MTDLLAQPLTLPCGATLSNRICKAAMTEGLSDPLLRATPELVRLYGLWSDGGSGLLITGNVQIDHRVLERPGNVAIDHNGGLEQLKAWAAAGTRGGNHLWMQISHAGRQSPRYVTSRPLAPSPVQLPILGNYATPRALTGTEIHDFIQRFAQVSRTAKDCGFTGVQVHAAHGYLLSSFLSPVTNQRTDEWGGSIENRARFLLEVLRAVRKAVGPDFPIGVKLNSDDFRKGGFSHEDCLHVVQMLNAETVDLLEISGGTYEQPRLLGGIGDNKTMSEPQRHTTRQREAYFLDYAERIRTIAKMPLMVTGGFRTRAGMEDALREGHCDVIGTGRPHCTDTAFARRLLAREIDRGDIHERGLKLGTGKWLSPASPITLIKMINTFGAAGWYFIVLLRIGRNQTQDLQMGVLKAMCLYFADELCTAWRMHRARRNARR